MAILTKTLHDAGFDGIFKEVSHSESLCLKNPNELRMFCLNVSNNAFSFDAMQEFLLDNIGSYIYSRAKIDQFILDGKERSIGAKAIGLIMKKIEVAKMKTYSFYFYILPFNDAEVEKESIMRVLMGGGT